MFNANDQCSMINEQRDEQFPINRKIIKQYLRAMQVRFTNSPAETAAMNTQELRNNFLLDSLFVNDEVRLVYSHMTG
jgi:hypothetical protein